MSDMKLYVGKIVILEHFTINIAIIPLPRLKHLLKCSSAMAQRITETICYPRKNRPRSLQLMWGTKGLPVYQRRWGYEAYAQES